MMIKILILCTGNSCRSQMAEGFLKSFDKSIAVYSAGTKPEKNINPYTIKVMNEVGIDISKYKPKNINQFINQSFDFVITVCDNAKEMCPAFNGKVKKMLHIGFNDPAAAKGSTAEKLLVYRKIRDEIKQEFLTFYIKIGN
ncbi:MAG: arsenate reductase ArsC [Bacteroidetes bacterium]|nr:arsenate reductase ArsC [Bacteroidota bacterium]